MEIDEEEGIIADALEDVVAIDIGGGVAVVEAAVMVVYGGGGN
jgi:hypothetical protein